MNAKCGMRNAELALKPGAGADVPGWKLERYLLGELPEGELDAIRALELSDDGLRKRISALRGDDAVILGWYAPERMGRMIDAERIRRSNLAEKPAAAGGRREARGFRNVPRWAVPALACAAVLVILPVGLSSYHAAGRQDVAMTEPGDRVKGAVSASPAIEVWRKEGEAARKLAPSDAAREGDVVQLRYLVPESCYGALVSVDGRGVLTVHLSGKDGKAAPLTPGKPIALNSSYELDDAPAFEAFYLITAPEAFNMESVERSLKEANHPVNGGNNGLSLTPEKKVTAFTLLKPSNGGIN